MEKYREWFNFKGRLSREPFVIRAVISYALILFCASAYEPLVSGSGNINDIGWGRCIFHIIILLPSLWVFYASANRRFHDIGKGSLWTVLLFLASPLFIIWTALMLYLVFKGGTVGDNEYGPDPLMGERKSGVPEAGAAAQGNDGGTASNNDEGKENSR